MIVRPVSTWSTVALSLGGVAIGAAAALTGTGMQLRRARLDRERADRAAWRDRAARVLGPVLGVLDDMEPRAIAEHGGRSEQTIANIGRRWWRARDDLLVFGVASPSPEIASGSQRLAQATAQVWTSMTTLNQALHATGENGHQVDGALVERASSDHEQAMLAARTLEEFSRR
jgi:hypothetical protein